MKIYRFQNILCFLCFFSLFYCLFSSNSSAGQDIAVKAGDRFPNIQITGAFTLEDKKYLGLSDRKVHSLSCIRAGFILVNCFSIYCPVCQARAVKFNQLHDLVQRDNFISRNMKMIGIGMGNNSKELAYFKKYFNISYPLIPDSDFKIHKALKETRTPLVVIIDKRLRPYKILTILDFGREPEKLIEDIRASLRKIKLGH